MGFWGFGVWRRDQQEAEYAVAYSSSASSERVPSREARGCHLQDQHGKEVQGAPPRKQEQSGQYIYKLKTKYQEEGW